MDLNKYAQEMAKSIWDKAFFMDKIIGVKCVIDFGCADGAMIRALSVMFPEIEFWGFDINDELIDMAWKAYNENLPKNDNIKFFRAHRTSEFTEDSFTDMLRMAKHEFYNHEICLNFSCVLHEVFSSSPEGKETIKQLITELKPKYITIRDMYYNGSDGSFTYKSMNDIIKKFNIDEHYIEEFETANNTSILTKKGFLHFLMKYQWKDNDWEQELKEDYFSWTLYDLFQLTGPYYQILFEAHYLLPYYAEKWKDIGILPTTDHTHAQFILRRI